MFSPMNALLQRLRRIIGPEGDAASDAQLLTAYAAGEASAFEEIVGRHGRMVHGVCQRLLGNAHDADDAFQAVFMVLARKAGSLRHQESVASWLYGVACRTAKKARVSAARRRRREEVVATMTREDIADAESQDSVGPVLDEEVNRLPEKYRLPVLLCYLEGESNEDAARRLRCSTGAVKMRLLRARELLRSRLGRRGVAVSAVALGTLLEGQAASASVPAPLLDSTLKAAHAFAAGSAAGAASAVALAQGVIRDMSLAKMKWIAIVVFALGVVGIGVGLSVQGQERQEPTTTEEQVAIADEAKPAPTPEEGPVDKAAVVAGNNRFGFELLGRVSKPNTNAFVSPYSIESALSMTYAGARGETAAEMARTLHFANDQERWHPAFASLTADLRSRGDKPVYELHVVNRLWGQVGAQFHEAFLKTTSDSYGAGIEAIDFKADTEKARKTINGWVEKQTRDKIPDLIQKDQLKRDTRLVLTNAIYFKSAWQDQFSVEATRPEDFHTGSETVKVPMMNRTNHFGYSSAEDFEVVSLPYKNNALSMLIVLPKKTDGLAAVEKDVNAARLKEMIDKLKPTRIQLSMPKFKLVESYDLEKVLEAMGMPKAFLPREADFSGMSSEPLYIAKVVHKALVDVDENGTEAAAATAVIVGDGGVIQRDKPIVVKADHPFLFLIRENRSGAVLFLGRLVKPATK
jgi:serpin B